MQIRVACPECGKSFQIPERFAGRDGECSKCQAVFHIPEKSTLVPDARRQPQRPSHAQPRPAGSGVSSNSASHARHDAGVTEEISVYSIEPSDEFEGPADVTIAAPSPPVFDITEDDLIPDDEDLADSEDSIDPFVTDSESEHGASSHEADPTRTQRVGRPSESRERRLSKPDRTKRAVRQRRLRPHPDDTSANDPDPNLATPQENVDSDILDRDDSAAESAGVPMLRRRVSDEERSESPSLRARSTNATARDDDNEQPSRRPDRKANPQQLAILGGIGTLLLIGAGLYSHFSAPAAPVLPVVVDPPTPAAEGDSPDEGSKPSEADPAAKPDASEDDSAADAPDSTGSVDQS